MAIFNDRDFCAVFVLLGCALILEGRLHIPKSSEVPVSNTINRESFDGLNFCGILIIWIFAAILSQYKARVLIFNT